MVNTGRTGTVRYEIVSLFSIHHLMVGTIMTQSNEVRDKTNTFKMLRTKLKYGVKNMNQLCNLPYFFLYFLVFDT